MNQTPVAIALTLLGLVVAFYGHRLLKVLLIVVGFGLGALGGNHLLFMAGISASTPLLIGTVICGLLGALLTFPLYIIGVFALGAVSGAFIVSLIGLGYNPLIVIIGALGGGILAIVLQRPLVILVTAVDGAALALVGLLALLQPRQWGLHELQSFQSAPDVRHYPTLFWLVAAMLAFFAAVYQFRNPDRRPRTRGGVAKQP
ncbi:hypothetical protein ACFL6M_02970 [Candidatus Eisenbacteria bacterium]|uniref:DUF4203 domain-containing protein n=1 Tax=Eiseniibacteriota bacterium TaxID=2212470 RepID=A0ABV6YJN5_UNCEI